MTKICALMFAVMFAGSEAYAATPAPAANTPESAKLFVQDFYDWYMARIVAATAARRKTPSADFGFNDAIRLRKSSFAPELYRLLKLDVDSSAKCPGEVVGLDWDPFLASQDPAPVYKVSGVERLQGGYRVSLEFHNKSYARVRQPVVQADVALVQGHWAFTNFIDSPTDPESRSDIVQTIRRFQRSGEFTCPKD